MRETQNFAVRLFVIVGITPAYAGNTRVIGVLKDGNGDHPRVCGKHGFLQNTLLPVAGSPPRMRETLARTAICQWMLRITPAYAGNTNCFAAVNYGITDHPRVCGKH